MTILDFLVSEATQQDGEWDTSGKPASHPELLDPKFFDLVGTAYMTHLHSAIHGFGVSDDRQDSGEQNFTLAYSLYAQRLLASIETWCKEREATILEHDRDLVKYLDVLDSLPERLEAVLAQDLFLDSDVGMNLPTNAPILCNYFLTDITGFFSLHIGSVLEVFRMLDPFFCDAIHAKGGSDAYSLLVNWVQREDPGVNPKKVIYKVILRRCYHPSTWTDVNLRYFRLYSSIGLMA